MREFNEQVFDENINGSATVWYTSSEHNRLLGSSARLAIHAVVTEIGGTSPTLTLRAQSSGDSQHWIDVSGTAQINAQPLSNGQFYAYLDGYATFLHYLRLSITMGGTAPACRLKLYACGRSF